jgi:hypothetical protein
VVLYRPFSVVIFLHALLSSLYTPGASRRWCSEGCECYELPHLFSMLFYGFVKQNSVRTSGVDGSTSYYGPVRVQFIV